MRTMSWMTGLALMLAACEDTEPAVQAPFDAVGSWSIVQVVDTVAGNATFTDYPLSVGSDLMWVTYDLSTDGTYESAVTTEAPNGSTSVTVSPDPLTWEETGDRSIRMLVTDGDPLVELDCAADAVNNDVLYCTVEVTLSSGANPNEQHAVTLERL